MAGARLRIFGRVDLDGTHRAIIESSNTSFSSLKRQGGPPPTIHLEGGGKSCAVLLAEYRTGEAESVFVDRNKLRHLGLKDGETVWVEETLLPSAKSIRLKVPAEFTKQDFIRFIGKPAAVGETLSLFSFSGEAKEARVVAVDPAPMAIIESKTECKLVSEEAEGLKVRYSDIGGLAREVRRIREVVEYPFKFPELFTHLGVTPPKGIILHGPPGTGKTLIAKALAHETGARFYAVSGPEIYSKWYGKSEESLRNVFDEAVKNAPSIVAIDELDALVPRREKTHGDQEQRIVATFLTQMDGLKQMENVVVLGTTNRIDAIDPALRRGGRFECEVYVGPPDGTGRLDILKIHTRGMPLEKDIDFEGLVRGMNGYVGADIASVCREAAYNALRRHVDLATLDGDEMPDTTAIRVSDTDFKSALSHVSPSAGKGILAETPAVLWEEVGGLKSIKGTLEENITLALHRREALEKVGIKPASGILLFGPPGTGKTLLARAVATECGVNFISVKGSSLRSQWIGETESNIRQVFAKAKTLAPCVIFFDEIDAAVPKRSMVNSRDVDAAVNQVLAEMDGIDTMKGVVVIGATNRIELLDPAVLRPGRFDQHIEVPLPEEAERTHIFEVHLKKKPTADDVSPAAVARVTNGFSGADIAEVCRDAAWSALRRTGFDVEKFSVTQKDLTDAAARVALRHKEMEPS